MDLPLIEKIFWVFDEDGSGDIKYEELAFGFVMFKKTSNMEDKIRVLLEICDFQKKGSINKLQLFELLKKNIINTEEKVELKHIINKIFNSVELSSENEITL